jgi:histone-arginine methyltransferase CARM1
MASRIRKLLTTENSKNSFNKKITVLDSKVEHPDLLQQIPKVDAIISEPIGVFLVHERMIESFLYARDHFLKPGGTLLPNAGTLYLAPVTLSHSNSSFLILIYGPKQIKKSDFGNRLISMA